MINVRRCCMASSSPISDDSTFTAIILLPQTLLETWALGFPAVVSTDKSDHNGFLGVTGGLLKGFLRQISP
jgi:hypothetical protein